MNFKFYSVEPFYKWINRVPWIDDKVFLDVIGFVVDQIAVNEAERWNQMGSSEKKK